MTHTESRRVCLMGCVAVAWFAGVTVAGRQAETTSDRALATRPAADGWEAYVDPPMVDAVSVEDLDPELGAPEAAVMKFLASRLRGDRLWEQALVPAGVRGDRLNRQLEEWDAWALHAFQLRARKATSDASMWIKTFFRIVVDGDADEGEDEFEIRRVDGVWYVAAVPS